MTDFGSIPAQAADRIIEKGWTHGEWVGEHGEECLHQAVQRCSPQTGDGFIVSAWLTANGYPTDWNDEPDRTRDDVLFLLKGLDLTDADLEETFGANWREWVALVRLFVGMTSEQAQRLDAAWAAARAAARATAADAAGDAAWAAAWAAARAAAGDAARAAEAAWAAAWAAARATAADAAGDAAGAAARATAADAAGAAIAKPYIGDTFTQAHYDLLMSPVVEVFGENWRELVEESP